MPNKQFGTEGIDSSVSLKIQYTIGTLKFSNLCPSVVDSSISLKIQDTIGTLKHPKPAILAISQQVTA
mgnify:CR=1 FL=1